MMMGLLSFRHCVSATIGLALAAAWGPALAAGQTAPSPGVEFNRQIRPILSEKCFRCHGPDSAQRQAGLRLDEREAALTARKGWPAIVPGKPSQSALYKRITATGANDRMPPADSGQKLSLAEIEQLKRWIEQGAPYERHWAFVAPRAEALPQVRLPSWPKNAIDFIVLARLEREGIRPALEADKATLLRRVSLDLTGLPPTPREVDAFVADLSANAYEKAVDRLLASPRYGECMAQDWLDAARYADTNGYFSDFERQIWRWREWVIDAFNQNKPFDQFTIEQLAGDLLPGATQDHLIATGFNRNHMVTNETGIFDEEYRTEYVADRVDTMATVWLGLTAGCARCHDHKFDPLKQKEYYQLFAFFNQVPEKGLITEPNPAPLLSAPTLAQQQQLQILQRRHSDAQRRFKQVEPTLHADLKRWEMTAESTLPSAPSTDLDAYYDFDNRLIDATGNWRPAEARGTLKYEAGVQGTALAFDNAQHAELPAGAGPNIDGPWTISLWARPTATSAGYLITKVEPMGGRGLEIYWRKSHFAARLGPSRSRALEASTTEPAAINEWHHVVVAYDGAGKPGSLRLFVDGVAQEAKASDVPGGSASNGEPWRIGRSEATLGFQGRIDELRFYHRPLTGDEVSNIYRGDLVRSILATPPDKRSAKQKEQLLEYFIARHAPAEMRTAYQQLMHARKQEDELRAAIPTTLVMRDMERPRDTYLLVRGQYNKHGDKVEATVPAFLPQLPPGAIPNRLGLARWLVSRDNPLTSRVIVNRYWQHFFGEGLVKSSNDFGAQGDWPSHPELLDWLAVQFVESGWNVKALHKLIVTSATYRQSSRMRMEDPANRLLARGPSFRLSAETIRDQALYASGLLVEKIGGPSVKPYQPPGLWEAVSYDAQMTYRQDHGDSLYRRGLYTFWKRQAPPPAMLSFDGPTRETCTVKRQSTNTPLQALVLLNDPTYVEAARALATQAMHETGDEPARARFAFRRALGRTPAADEVERLVRLFRLQHAEYRDNLKAARALLGVGERPLDKDLDPAELAAWTTVASVILNLHETITRP